MKRLFLAPAVGLVALALPLAGCGSSSKSSSSASSASGGTAVAAGGSAPSRAYTISLSGAQETSTGAPGAHGAPTGHGGVSISLRGKTGQVCWHFRSVTGMGTPNAAHLHQGAGGVAGPVIVPLGASFTRVGCTPVSPSVLKAIAANPKGYYANVHSAKYPNGGVRGQL